MSKFNVSTGKECTVDEIAADGMRAATIDMDRRSAEAVTKYRQACGNLQAAFDKEIEAIRIDYNAACLLARKNAEQHAASLAATQRKESLADQHAKELAYFGGNVHVEKARQDGKTLASSLKFAKHIEEWKKEQEAVATGNWKRNEDGTIVPWPTTAQVMLNGRPIPAREECRTEVQKREAYAASTKACDEARANRLSKQVTIYDSVYGSDTKNFVLATSDVDKVQRLLDSLTSNNLVAVKLATKALEVVDTLLRKNSDYGGKITEQSPSLAPDVSPSKAILVRLSDKYERMINLLTNGNQQVAESFNETMLDEIGYSILYLVSQEN